MTIVLAVSVKSILGWGYVYQLTFRITVTYDVIELYMYSNLKKILGHNSQNITSAGKKIPNKKIMQQYH